MNNNKINLLFDGSLLPYIVIKDSMRSGIFFTSLNILNELSNRNIFNITIFYPFKKIKCLKSIKKYYKLCNYKYIFYFEKYNYSSLKNKIDLFVINEKKYLLKLQYLFKIIKYSLILLLYYFSFIFIYSNRNKVLKITDIYFSPDSAVLYNTKKYSHIINFLFLHDVMPLHFPNYYPSLFLTNNNINEYAKYKYINNENIYFCNSNCTKNDILHYYNSIINENNLYVSYISTSQEYIPDYNNHKLFNIFNKYNIKLNQNVKYLFSLCTLEPRKNLIFSIKCFINFIIKNQIDDLYFFLGGGQWNFFIDKLKKQISNFDKYSNRIIRLGYIDDEDVNILYSNSLFFIYISQYEGFGMPTLEAMQSGTPVITSNNSSLPEVVGDAAIMIDCNSEEQCINAMEKFYFNEDLRKKYIKKGLERSKLFSWKKTVDCICENIFDNIKCQKK